MGWCGDGRPYQRARVVGSLQYHVKTSCIEGRDAARTFSEFGSQWSQKRVRGPIFQTTLGHAGRSEKRKT